MALKKFCGCGRIISQSEKYCSICVEKYTMDKKKTYINYKHRRKDDREQKFYCSEVWRITRDTIRLRDKGTCQVCKSNGKRGLIDHVHHIIELKENWFLRTAQSNLIGLCDRCHYYVHRKYKINEKSKKEVQDELLRLIKG